MPSQTMWWYNLICNLQNVFRCHRDFLGSPVWGWGSQVTAWWPEPSPQALFRSSMKGRRGWLPHGPTTRRRAQKGVVQCGLGGSRLWGLGASSLLKEEAWAGGWEVPTRYTQTHLHASISGLWRLISIEGLDCGVLELLMVRGGAYSWVLSSATKCWSVTSFRSIGRITLSLPWKVCCRVQESSWRVWPIVKAQTQDSTPSKGWWRVCGSSCFGDLEKVFQHIPVMPCGGRSVSLGSGDP